MLLAAILAATGTRMFISLTGAMDNLFLKSVTPHFVQMHSGDYDKTYADKWINENTDIKSASVKKIYRCDEVTFKVNDSMEEMDQAGSLPLFILQNDDIDILLNKDNKKISVTDGNIAVPIYFMQKEDLKIGDTLTVEFADYKKTFTISDFIRDSQYGNSMIQGKRFIVSEHDIKELADNGATLYNYFSYLLKDESRLVDFTKDLQASDMPQNEYFIDISLVRMAYGVGDGIVIGMVLLCSVLLVLVAFMTLRYTILSTIEEDFWEIGVMKAIGFKLKEIIKLYISKYFYLASIACVLGYVLGQPLSDVMSSNLLLYLGTPDNDALGIVVSLCGVLLIFVMVLLFCFVVLHRIGKMTAIDAIRMGNIGETYKENKFLALTKKKYINVNVFIGFKDILLKVKSYILLLFVFLICTFICILPVNVKNTLGSHDFIAYCGMALSDLSISFNMPDGEESIEPLAEALDNNKDVTNWEAYITSYYQIRLENDETLRIRTMSGDHAAYTFKYSSGSEPVLENEVALSYLAAQDQNKKVGDSIVVIVDGKDKNMIVTGIFQCIANGGRLMALCLEPDIKDAHLYQIKLNLSSDVDVDMVADKYQELYKNSTVQTLEMSLENVGGSLINQLDSICILIAVIALLVSMLITSLFIKMLIVKIGLPRGTQNLNFRNKRRLGERNQ